MGHTTGTLELDDVPRVVVSCIVASAFLKVQFVNLVSHFFPVPSLPVSLCMPDETYPRPAKHDWAGRSEVSSEAGTLVVELRSVNHRG